MESRRVLIVEDEEGLAYHLAFLLKRMNYVPLEAVAYGEKVLERTALLHPDLVLMDINLAGQMDGIEAARQISDECGTPVIFLSALTEDATLHEATSSNPYGYLVKPVKEPELRAAIEMALYKHGMENRLRESEQRYRLLFEKMADGFGLGEIICDENDQPADFRFLDLNPAFEQMTGVDKDFVLGHTLKETLPDFNGEYLIKAFGRVALTGESTHFEFCLNRLDRYLDITAYSPKPGQFATVVEDITKRRKAEQTLLESETRFRQLAEGVREVFWLSQRDTGQFLYISPTYERVFGRPCEELYRNPGAFFDCIHPEDRSRVEAAQKELFEQGTPLDAEYRIIRPNGAQRWIWARTFPVVDESGKVNRFSGIAEDVTERRQSEEQLRESYNRLEHSLRRLTTLRNIDQAITTQADLSSLASIVLTFVADRVDIDAAVLFVPNLPSPGRLRGTGPLSMLRLAGIAGLPEEVLDGTVMNWQTSVANLVYQTSQAVYIQDLRSENHLGAQSLSRRTELRICAVLPLAARGQVKGVLQFFRRGPAARDPEWLNYLQSLALQTAIGIDNVEMSENLKRSNRELALAYDETIKGWAQALELRDKETRGHADRVSDLTVRLGTALGIKGEPLDHMRRGAFLHDIGKMAIPDSILGKTGSLSSDEWITMRQHPKVGYDMLSNIEYLRPAMDVVLFHHEKWDGSGYPHGLKGEDIPLAARIFAVIDVWDALTVRRPYRLAWPENEVRAYLRDQSGKHFDPRIVEEFLRIV